jgi:hypothetical protein
MPCDESPIHAGIDNNVREMRENATADSVGMEFTPAFLWTPLDDLRVRFVADQAFHETLTIRPALDTDVEYYANFDGARGVPKREGADQSPLRS